MLTNLKEIEVKFSEVDSMTIVWHGHYIRYFEDGREAFGREFGLGYMHVYEKGFFIPIVNINCNFKKPIRYNDQVMIQTTFMDTPAAKLKFNYKLYNKNTEEIYATGASEQVFLTKSNELHLTVPDFLAEWKLENGITTK
jgi:acyl-CoA thioester hydrolase